MNQNQEPGTRNLESFVLVFLLLLSCIACSRPEQTAAPPQEAVPALLPVSLPDLSRADGAVQVQAQERYAALEEKRARGVPDAELGDAYGQLAMLLQAAEYHDSAEPSYLNAQALMPEEPRWPYYLGLLYQARGRPAEAEGAFRRTLELAPEDVPALVRLGRLYFERGDIEAAKPLFERARAASPRSVAALAGLGQVALAEGQPERAATFLEEGLSANPDAVSLHAPLATAYRALGRVDVAESHLKRWRNTEVPLADPRRDDLEALLESGLAYEVRGLRALSGRDWETAAVHFRKGIELSPPGSTIRRSLHHKLGTALWMGGDARGAVEQFEQVARLAPPEGTDEPSSKANYSLGIVAASEGRTGRAVEHLSRAIAYGPNYTEAYVALGDVLQNAGRAAEALKPYQEAIARDPRNTAARVGHALSLMRLQRWSDARAWLDESVRRQPDEPDLRYLLARLLAAAPDPGVRDGHRALALAEALAQQHQTTAAGETLAMALAETGDYEEASRLQRGVLEVVQHAAPPDYVTRVRERLRRYESRQPSRTPWTDADPLSAAAPPG